MTSFFPTKATRIIPGVGPHNAKIAIVGEAGGAHENIQLKPFVGPAGGVLEQCLHAADLTRSEVYLTNVVKLQPPGNNISPYFDGKTFSAAGHEWVLQLQAELEELNPNVVVACGKTAMAALTGNTYITQLRGYVMPSIGMSRIFKVIPAIHPAASLYDRKGGDKGSLTTKEFKPYLYRHVISMDLGKAKVESLFPELRRPERQLVYEFGTVTEALEWLAYYESQPILSVDIEVTNHEIACISFCSDPKVAMSLPLADGWLEQEELELYRGMQRTLGNPNSIKVLQNSIFDRHFLLTKCGIRIAGPIHDTMVAHSIIYPDLPKSLAFLGSLYCGSQAFWKDFKFTNIKEEA
jgi:uracil-DNA glycosylase family 4